MNSAAKGFDGNTFGGVSSVLDFQARFGTNVASDYGFLAAITFWAMSLDPSWLVRSPMDSDEREA